MTFWLGLSRAIDATNRRVGLAVAWLVLLMTLVSAANAISRKVFSVSSNAFLEVQWYLFAAVFLLAAGSRCSRTSMYVSTSSTLAGPSAHDSRSSCSARSAFSDRSRR